MKTLQINTLALVLGVQLIGGCAKFGGPAPAGQATTNDNTATKLRAQSELLASDVPVLKATKQAALANTAYDSVAFLEDLSSATFSIVSRKLRLVLKDSSGNTISLPSSFLTASRYKDTEKYVLINLRSGSAATSVVIHKASGKAFLTKDSELDSIVLSAGASNETMTISGAQASVVKITVVPTDTSESAEVTVGLDFRDDHLYARRMN